MTKSVFEKNSRQLWKEVRKLRNSKSVVTNCMDKKTGCENIAELFSEKYSELYNSVSYESDQLTTITSHNQVKLRSRNLVTCTLLSLPWYEINDVPIYRCKRFKFRTLGVKFRYIYCS